MREIISKILNGYISAKREPFAGHPMGAFFRNEIPNRIYSTGIVNSETHLVTGSVGQGQWVTIPWICIFDHEITTTATKGVYIAYLLSRGGNTLYLTFMQGCTDIRNTHRKRDTIRILREKAGEIASRIDARGFNVDNDIDLGSNLTGLAELYQPCTIFYKAYHKDAIPPENELRDDLSKMMAIYADYSNHFKTGIFGSWEIIDKNTAVKHCDKSFFDYNGSGVPKEICWFFGAEDLEQGAKIQISLIYGGKQFNGRISKESSDWRRVQIFWGADLGKLFAEKQNVSGVIATFKKTAVNTYSVDLLDSNEVDSDSHAEFSVSEGGEEELSVKGSISGIKQYIKSQGFSYEDDLIENFYLSLKSKPFVILAGISGTGKTRLVKLFAEAVGATAENGRYKMVSVRPDWSDSSDLFGHVDLNGKFVPGAIIDFIKRAELDISRPYFLCLDEMNLARVEYYLSDILSVIETRDFHNGTIETAPLISDTYYGADTSSREKYGEVKFPENLYIIGTVNMDETTFPFSRKVLDRANTIEFSYVDLMQQLITPFAPVNAQNLPNSFLKTEYLLLTQCVDETEAVGAYCSELQNINQILQKANAHVGYRVRDEIVFYLLSNKKADLMSEDKAMDHEIMQKILPRIQGSSAAIKDMLCELFKYCAGDYSGYQTEDDDISAKMLRAVQDPDCKYKKSAEKIAFMVRRYEEDGFTSYWL